MKRGLKPSLPYYRKFMERISNTDVEIYLSSLEKKTKLEEEFKASIKDITDAIAAFSIKISRVLYGLVPEIANKLCLSNPSHTINFDTDKQKIYFEVEESYTGVPHPRTSIIFHIPFSALSSITDIQSIKQYGFVFQGNTLIENWLEKNLS